MKENAKKISTEMLGPSLKTMVKETSLNHPGILRAALFPPNELNLA